MSKFKVGDKVRVAKSFGPAHTGKVGDVVGHRYDCVCVRFPGWTRGHAGKGFNSKDTDFGLPSGEKTDTAIFYADDRGWDYAESVELVERPVKEPARPVTEDSTPPSKVTKNYIVCVLDQDCAPLPAEKPVTHVHCTDAYNEAKRLARVHEGQVFAVYSLIDAVRAYTVPARQDIEVLF